jgi:hypothetical protein
MDPAGPPAMRWDGCLADASIAPALNQDVEHDATLIHGAPQPMLPARDAERDLVEMPFVSMRLKTFADLVGRVLAELEGLLTHGLMAHLNPAGGQHLLHHAQAEGKPEVQPDGIADHVSPEAMADITTMTGRFHTSSMPASHYPEVNLTMPLREPSRSHGNVRRWRLPGEALAFHAPKKLAEGLVDLALDRHGQGTLANPDQREQIVLALPSGAAGWNPAVSLWMVIGVSSISSNPIVTYHHAHQSAVPRPGVHVAYPGQ